MDRTIVLDQHDRLGLSTGWGAKRWSRCSRWAMKSLLRLVELVWTMSWRVT